MIKDGSLRFTSSIKKKLGTKSFSSPRFAMSRNAPATSHETNRNQLVKIEVMQIEDGLRNVRELERKAENPTRKRKWIPKHLQSLQPSRKNSFDGKSSPVLKPRAANFAHMIANLAFN
jgi:hypothetical protein